MKKITIFVLTLYLAVALSACQKVEISQSQKEEKSMFVKVEVTSQWSVVYHRDTKVMYAVSNGGYNGGTFTRLDNADGSPMLWEN